MNQADKDAAQWMEANAKWQRDRMIYAKEEGKLYHIDETGYVIIEKEKDESAPSKG